ncbi:MAG TPA: D-glycero-beta-D-manno-heptose 1-phosphate adenylyltransferase [Myxococcota bacterium]|nr:D-glycero-beta-D-manno-heptose 1-phosphate adenylyltransferase [Myxococcota bacterium]
MTARPRSARRKLLSRRAARAALQQARRRGERVVFTNGCFDLLHVGHVRSLERARRCGDRLLVAVNGDASVRRLKGRGRPIVPARRRAEVVAALECVDWVVVFAEDTPLALIRSLRPDVLAKGGDWQLEEIVGRAEIESWGGRVVRIPVVRGARTTALVTRIRGD